MGMTTTLILAGAFAAVFFIGGQRMSKPADPLRPRLIPWRSLMVLSGFACILMLVHVVNLLGVETGRAS